MFAIKKIQFAKSGKSVKTANLLHKTAAKTKDFESSVKVKFLRDWPLLLDELSQFFIFLRTFIANKKYRLAVAAKSAKWGYIR